MVDGSRMPKSPFAILKQLKNEFGGMTPRSFMETSRSSSPCIIRPASLDQSQTFRLSTSPDESVPRFTVEGIFSDSEAASSRRSSSSPQQFMLSPTKSESASNAPSDTQWMDCDIPIPESKGNRNLVGWGCVAVCAALIVGHTISATTPYRVYF
jgi:hypothetical protein